MNKSLTLVAAIALGFAAQTTFGQAASSPTRAEVKAETKAAPKTPAGEGLGKLEGAPDTKTQTTRAARKAQTQEDRKEGELAAAGPSADNFKAPSRTTEKTRAQRKAETQKAAKNKQMAPAGEGVPGANK